MYLMCMELELDNIKAHSHLLRMFDPSLLIRHIHYGLLKHSIPYDQLTC